MAEFMFVNLNNPTQNKRREVRKLVRSHVSYMQHSQKRTELGQVQKPSKSRYTDRSVNGWAVLDDSIAARSSQLKVDSASGLNSGLLPQHQSTVPGSVQVRLPRQMYDKELTATGKSRRRPRQSPRQPKAPATPPATPVLGDEVNAKQESPQPMSTLPIVKSEDAVTSPKGVVIKQEPEYQMDHRWDIVPQHSSRSQSLSSASTSQWDWESDEPSPKSFAFFFSNLKDPTDELRTRVELSRISLSSVMAFIAHTAELMGQDCDKLHSLPKGSFAKILLTSLETDPAARAAILLAAVAAIRRCRQEPLQGAALFSLRGYAISCMQAAMSDPATRYSDNTALAIVSMGNFERCFGSEEAYGTHAHGLAFWKDVRGGSIDWVLASVLSWMPSEGIADLSRSTSIVLRTHF